MLISIGTARGVAVEGELVSAVKHCLYTAVAGPEHDITSLLLSAAPVASGLMIIG